MKPCHQNQQCVVFPSLLSLPSPQVHSAVLPDGRHVAMKVQYPGVARSIESDIQNLMRLVQIGNILPPGLYAQNAAKVNKCTLPSVASATNSHQGIHQGSLQNTAMRCSRLGVPVQMGCTLRCVLWWSRATGSSTASKCTRIERWERGMGTSRTLPASPPREHFHPPRCPRP